MGRATRTTKRIALAAGMAMLFAVTGHPVNAQEPSRPAVQQPEITEKVRVFLKRLPKADGDTELQSKLKQRHNAAIELLEARVAEYRRGVRDIRTVFDAARTAAEIKLQMADSPEERIQILEQTLDIARLLEKHMQQLVEAGVGARSDAIEARLGRLSVEIELLRARAAVKK